MMAILDTLKRINWNTLNIFDVIKGCTSKWLSDVQLMPEFVQKISKYRLGICEDCEINVDYKCDERLAITNIETGNAVMGCGCLVKCKTALLSQECPASKWKAVNKRPIQQL